MDDRSFRLLLQRATDPVSEPGPPPTAQNFAARHAHRRRAAGAALAAACVVVIIVAASVFVARPSPHSIAPATGTDSPSRPVGSVPATNLLSYRWSTLPAAPIEPRSQSASVWTGTQMIVWGGETYENRDSERDWANGAAYTPATRSWQELPAAPLSPRQAPLAVWTGRQMIVWGGEGGKNETELTDGAMYDPATHHWTRMARAPVAGWNRNGGVALVWTGSDAVLLTVPDMQGQPWPAHILVHAFDPGTNTWHTLPSAPFTTNNACACVVGLATDQGLYLWTSRLPGYHLARNGRHWEASTVKPLHGYCVDSAFWTGSAIILPADWEGIACGGDLPVSPAQDLHVAGTVVSPSGRRTRMADTPTSVAVESIYGVWTGGALVILSGTGAPEAWDANTNTWETLQPMPEDIGYGGTTIVWTGHALLVWGSLSAVGPRRSTAGVPSGLQLGPP